MATPSHYPGSLAELVIGWQKWFPAQVYITLSTTAEDYERDLPAMEARIVHFDNLTQALAASDKNFDKSKQFIEGIKGLIFKACLGQDFVDRYRDHFLYPLSVDEIKALLRRILGSTDGATKRRRLVKKLNEMVRRAEHKEPHYLFLNRILKTAEQAYSNKEVQDDMAESVWRRNLRDQDKAFLVHLPLVQKNEQDLRKRLEHEAAYLDSGLLHRRSYDRDDSRSIHAIDIAPDSYATRAQPGPSRPQIPEPGPQSQPEGQPLLEAIGNLVKSQQAFQEEFRRDRQETKTRMDTFEARLNSLATVQPPQNHPAPPTHNWNYPEMRARQEQQGQINQLLDMHGSLVAQVNKLASNSGPATNSYATAATNKGSTTGGTSGGSRPNNGGNGTKKTRRKYRPCEECGLNGHKAEDCRGTDLTCNYCGAKGHITSSVRHHPELNRFLSKN